MSERPRIQFILPMAGVTGGVAVVYRYANALHRAGFPVRIIYPGVLFPALGVKWRIEAWLRSVKYWLDARRGKSEADWFPLEVPLIRVPSLEGRYIPPSDITVVTSCETAEWAGKYSAKLGTVYYFVQGYETWTMPEDRLIATFNLPFHKAAVAKRLANQVSSHSNEAVETTLPNGVDPSLFFPPKKEARPNHPPVILTLSHELEAKGTADAAAVIANVRAKYPDVKVVSFGMAPKHPSLPDDTEYHQSPDRAALRELYQRADIFLCASHGEGWPLVNMEAMACGSTVVTTDVGGVPDFTTHKKTGMLADPHDIAGLTDAILWLLQDPKRMREIGTAAQKSILQFTWEIAEQRAVEYFSKLR